MIFNGELLVILGNGFDLHLGLKSKLKDFFDKKVFQGKTTYSGANLLYHLLFFRYFATGTTKYGAFERVDVVDPTWMDVEGFLKIIATNQNMHHLFERSYSMAINNVRVYSNDSQIILDALSNAIARRKHDESVTQSAINRLLLDDLIEFENSFKEYLNDELNNKQDYHDSSLKFLTSIVSSSIDGNDYNSELFVYNFNYTTIKGPKAISVTNVHGSLVDNNIVIGYDSTNDGSDDVIHELSKDWQKLNVKTAFDLRDINIYKIAFYGHSLGEQDYPYFFEIFDKCNLLDNKCSVELAFCYSIFDSEEEQRDFYNGYRISISKLLNAYERYKKSSNCRNTIISKLKSQNRLHIVLIKG